MLRALLLLVCVPFLTLAASAQSLQQRFDEAARDKAAAAAAASEEVMAEVDHRIRMLQLSVAADLDSRLKQVPLSPLPPT